MAPLLSSYLRCALGLALALAMPSAWAQQTANGSVLFDAACAHCHGANGLGGQIGPSIVARVLADDDAALAAFLRTGSPERGMPPAAVGAEQLPALIDHLRFLASAAQQNSATADASPITRRNRRVENFAPVTAEELLQPDPADWLWFSRTADAQRHSPLAQIDRNNVATLGLAWSRGLPDGLSYTIPLVHDGVMYLATPTSTLLALDATTGDLIWEYQRQFDNPALASQNRAKTLAMFEDMIYFTAPDNTLIAVDAVDGSLRWEAPLGRRGNSAGVIVAKDKVISSGNCGAGPRDACFISAHDARSGKLLWSFNTVQGPDDTPDGDTWAGVPLEQRLASPWGLPGSYDPATDLIYWGIANPMPTSRLARHGDGIKDVANAAPSDLYSNSTVALDPDTGALQWYYQHLPGDDWDLDMNEERTLVRTALDLDADAVRWINPRLQPGEVRDVVMNVGEGGGVWALDAHSGEFLWATPFPFAPDNFMLEDIDVDTGITHINRQLLLNEPGERKLVCYLNTRSFWPTAYSPLTNSLYVPYIRNCLDMTAASADGPERRVGAPEPDVAPDELNGLAKIDLQTGRITHWPMGRIPTTSAMLTTAGGLVFWGDLDRHYRAMDADTGAVLWQTRLGGPISMSNLSYAVDGRQYVAVIAGETLAYRTTTGSMGPLPLQLDHAPGSAAIYVFALPKNPRTP